MGHFGIRSNIWNLVEGKKFHVFCKIWVLERLMLLECLFCHYDSNRYNLVRKGINIFFFTGIILDGINKNF
jgi:hypothetical protein